MTSVPFTLRVEVWSESDPPHCLSVREYRSRRRASRDVVDLALDAAVPGSCGD